MNYTTKHTMKRGCGYRSGGGLYMVTVGAALPCGLLPFELDLCPTCGGGIKQTRSFQWINPQPLVPAMARGAECCPIRNDYSLRPFDCRKCWEDWGDRAGLLWIGASYYETPEDWLKESAEQGVSRRISSVPNDFEIGKHWVLAAHPKAIAVKCEPCHGTGSIQDGTQLRCEQCSGSGTIDYKKGIFAAFKPTAIERVLTGGRVGIDREKDEKALLDEFNDFYLKHAEEHPDMESARAAFADSLGRPGEEQVEERKTWDKLQRLVKKGVQLVHDIPIKQQEFEATKEDE